MPTHPATTGRAGPAHCEGGEALVQKLLVESQLTRLVEGRAEVDRCHYRGLPGLEPIRYPLANQRQLFLGGPARPAGYRTCRSTEEQLAMITQWISDGFQAGQYTVMTPVDFSAAFDKARKLR
eukprot:gene5418-biopygen2314